MPFSKYPTNQTVSVSHSYPVTRVPIVHCHLKLKGACEHIYIPLHNIINQREGTTNVYHPAPVRDSSSARDTTSATASSALVRPNAAGDPAFRIPAGASYNSSDTKVDTPGAEGARLVFDNSSDDWYNNSHPSTSSSRSSSSFDIKDNAKKTQEPLRERSNCGDTCLKTSQQALLKKFSSCSFFLFGSRSASSAPAFSRQTSSSSSGSASAVSTLPKLAGSVYTVASHNPASGKRHFFLEIRAPVPYAFCLHQNEGRRRCRSSRV
jgi:hypothetical protein